jgi:hypothetical protein
VLCLGLSPAPRIVFCSPLGAASAHELTFFVTAAPGTTTLSSSLPRLHMQAVTFSTLICGFYPLLHSVLYIFLQVRVTGWLLAYPRQRS